MKNLPLALAVVASLLAGCASTGGLEAQSKPAQANQLAARESLAGVALSPAAWPREDWWESFGDTQLDQLIRDALAAQPSLRVAQARVRQAQAVAGYAEAALAPQVNASARSMQQRFSENSIYPKNLAGRVDSINDATLGLSYELDFWGRNHAAVDAALDRVHATEVDAQAARLMLTTSIARTYLHLDTAYLRRDLASHTLALREQTLALVRRRVVAQIDSRLEAAQAEAALPAARAQIAAMDESIALARNQLAALAGKGPDSGLVIRRPALAEVATVQLPSALPAELLGRRPDIVADRWRVEASGKDIQVARAGFYPNVTLNAFAGFQSIGLGDLLSLGSRALGFGPAISLPVFDGGRLRNNLGQRQAEYDAAVEKYNATLIAALHDVVDQIVSLQWLATQLGEQEQAYGLAREAQQIALKRYRSGLANYLQVLSAEAAVLSEERQLLESKARSRELRLNLIRALGGGYTPGAAPGPRPLPDAAPPRRST